MAYTLGNKCAKNLCKRIVLLQLIIENVVTFFWNTVQLFFFVTLWNYEVCNNGNAMKQSNFQNNYGVIA